VQGSPSRNVQELIFSSLDTFKGCVAHEITNMAHLDDEGCIDIPPPRLQPLRETRKFLDID
jgi:hypothetical protein